MIHHFSPILMMESVKQFPIDHTESVAKLGLEPMSSYLLVLTIKSTGLLDPYKNQKLSQLKKKPKLCHKTLWNLSINEVIQEHNIKMR